MLVDPVDWSLAQRIEDALEHLSVEVSPFVGAETHQAAIELSSGPHETVEGVIAQLAGLRGALAGSLASIGLRAASAGTHPSTLWTDTRVSPRRRYQEIHSTMRVLARREPTFALHVHIGVPDPERAIELMNRLRAHLPVLLALSANSPFWQGRDTGFASARTLIFQAFPRTGLPRRFSSFGDWCATADGLVGCGAISEPTYLWWDIRPQPRYGTVEVRIMDAQSTLERAAALGALVQSTARLELEQGYVSSALMCADEVLAENRFLAARDGVQARLIDPERRRLRPVCEQVDELLDAARPHAEALGCADELEGVQALMTAPAAELQRHRAGCEGLDRLVGGLVEDFDSREGSRAPT